MEVHVSDSDLPLFYSDLAHWWPLISPVSHYAEETSWSMSLLERAHRPVSDLLELGSGGGHSAFYLKQRYTLTLVDLSRQMLDVSAHLNPECTHLQGDMRAARLGELFDAVFVHDAIDYMLSEDDLAAVFETAWQHLRPGGILLAVPDHVRENFAASEEVGGTDAPDGSGVRYLAWSTDPDPDDTCISTEYAFVMRESDGRVLHCHEVHETGLFPEATWTRLLSQQGFVAETVLEETDEDRPPRRVFVAHKPSA